MASKTKGMEEMAEEIFGKSYTLKSTNEEYCMSEVSAMLTTEPFEIESLTKMRNRLNETKNLLNDKDIEPWRRHTKKTNPCGLVVKEVRERFNPELCTQAWAKFYEILNRYAVVPANCITNKRLKSFHLCEAPGAFIACLNHYIKCRFVGSEAMEWGWHASTLNPFYEGNDTKRMIEGEKFILEAQEHWVFGQCFDGDLMNWDILEDIQQAINNEKVDIQETNILVLSNGEKWLVARKVTADGSIDCADEPEKQETIIGQLLYCEIVAALTLLAPGGSFVVKMFTMFEHNTICLLYLLSCCFANVEIVKPGTSKAGNSEVYCVCTSFIGADRLPRELFEKLRVCYTCEPCDRSLFPKDMLPSNFLRSIEGCARQFSNYQIDAIVKNIDLFENSTKGKRKFLSKLREYITSEYLRRFDVVVLDQACFVVPHTRLTGSQLSYWPQIVKDFQHQSGHHSGCYQERMEIAGLSWQDRVIFPRGSSSAVKSEDELLKELMHDEPIRWLTGSPATALESAIESWTVRFGKPIEKIQSSRFCPSAFIEELAEARTSATVLQTQEGRNWMNGLEELCQEKLRPASHPHNIIDGILRKCHILSDTSEHRFVDISGDCRFLRELVGAGCYQADQCFGLLCRQCSEQRCADSPPSKFIVMASSCVRHTDHESGQLRGLCDKLDGSVNVIFGSVFSACESSSNYGELASREAFLNQCLVALKLLRNGESFVCEISDTLTQFTVGVLFILYMLFKDISVFPVVGNLKCSPRQFLVCRFYTPANNIGLTKYISHAAEVLMNKSCDHDVLCLLPTSNLFSKTFYMYLRQHTTRRIKSQLNFLINLERIWLRKHGV